MNGSGGKITDPTELYGYYKQLLTARQKEGVDTSEAEAIVKKAIFTYKCLPKTIAAFQVAIVLLEDGKPQELSVN